MAELAYAADLKSARETYVGSSPTCPIEVVINMLNNSHAAAPTFLSVAAIDNKLKAVSRTDSS